MSQDPNTDAEQTTAWPGTQPPGAPPSVPQSGGPAAWSPPTPNAGGGGWVPPTPPAAPGMVPPGGGYPSPYGQPSAPAAPEKSGSKKAVLAVIALVAVVAAAAAVVFFTPIKDKVFGTKNSTPQAGSTTSSATATSSTATTSASASPSSSAPNTPAPSTPAATDGMVDPSALQSYLATPAELTQRLDGAVMTPRGLVKEPFTGFDVSPDTCTGAAIPGIDTAYRGSGFTGFVGQVVNDDPGQNKVIQALISFPTVAAAQSFASTQANLWRGCNYTDLTISNSSNTDHIKTGVVATHDGGTFSMLMFPPTSVGRQCERAMSPRGNVVVDVRVCTASVGSLGYTIARDIGEKITGQR